MSETRYARRFWLGALVGLLWTVLLLLVEVLLAVRTIVQVVLELATALVPIRFLSWLLGRVEGGAKPLALLLVLLSIAVCTGLIGVSLVRWPRYRPWTLWILAVGSVVTSAWLSRTTLLLGLLVGVSSTACLIGGLAVVTRNDALSFSRQRRALLRVLGMGGLLVSIGAVGRLLADLQARSRPPGAVDERGLPPALTPIGDFYVVSKNVSDPVIDSRSWRLRIHGRVEQPLELDLAAITARPGVRMIATLECISNDVWGPYISTGEWLGVPLRDLLREARPVEPVVDVILRAADGYSDSVPFSVALHPSTLLAYGLNGHTLPPEHGFPLRLVVPGIYGMKQVKWITEIELSEIDYHGYWQQRGWSDTAIVRIHSRIDVPRDGSVVPVGQEVFIGGIAFAGDRGIGRVELSTDDGTTWQTVEQEAPLSPFSWVRWWMTWRPTVPGRYRLVVRAWDGRGQLQEPEERPPLPEGATGWHRVGIVVRASA
ncbi:MAG: molybdopterin-dependent oxidoreductase [Thermomicrobium sp.]|nr:molybdopterin-dependent oxidoreductase [Thermomicrobium sp.]